MEAPIEARTLVDVLEWHVARHPDRLHLTLLQDENTILGTLTYAELADRARKVAAGLAAADILPQDRVALMLPTGLDFFIAFFGVLICRRDPGADLPAHAIGEDRGIHAPPSRHPPQCGRAHSGHSSGRAALRFVASAASPEHREG